jgi:hypothetical protein
MRLFSPLAMALRVVALALPVCLLLGGTALFAAGIIGWLRSLPPARPDNLLLGLVCGLLVWLFLVVLHFRPEVMFLPVRDRGAWLASVQAHLQDLGYRAEPRGHGSWYFEPRFQALRFGGGIHVRVRLDSAVVRGPRMYLERLRHRLRMTTYLFKEPHSLGSVRARRMPRRWRKVEITAHVPAEQWQGIYDAVIAPLAREGAEVICQVHVLARGKDGISDTLIEGPIRDAFSRRGLHAEVQKDAASSPEVCLTS